jgi:hypothetical protein
LQPNEADQHVLVRIPPSEGSNSLRIHLKDDFGLAYDSTLPALGSTSEGLRVVSETWSPAHDRLTLAVSGLAGRQYHFSVWNPAQIASVSGAKLSKSADGSGQIVADFPANAAEPVSHATIAIQFTSSSKEH